jgi:1-acyl-sn-glycerol-3-phosphate acyltransferase
VDGQLPVLSESEQTCLYRLVVFLAAPVVRTIFRPSVTGLEHVPRSGGFVLCANQTSNLDGFALAYSLLPRQPYWMGKAELFTPLTRPLLARLGIFPVRRGMGDWAAIDTAIELARAGEIVGIFPEGTRRRKGVRKRQAARPRSGAARVALGAGVPLVPAAIRGTERVTALRRWRVTFGPPITIDDLHRARSARAMTERLWSSILELEAELWRPES